MRTLISAALQNAKFMIWAPGCEKLKMHDSAYIPRQECGEIVVVQDKRIHFSVDTEHSKMLFT